MTIHSLLVADSIESLRWNFGRQIYDLVTPAQDFKQSELRASSWGRPEIHKYGVSPRGAELYVADWLKFLGFVEVSVTPEERDGGYDIEADEYLVQVKNWQKGWIGVSYVRELVGVSAVLGRKSMFFFKGNMSDEAVEFARKAAMPVFSYVPEEGRLLAKNELALNLANDRLQKKIWKIQLAQMLEETEKSIRFLSNALKSLKKLGSAMPRKFGVGLSEIRDEASLLAKDLDDSFLSPEFFNLNMDSIVDLYVSARKSRVEVYLLFQQVEELLDRHQMQISVALSAVYETLSRDKQ